MEVVDAGLLLEVEDGFLMPESVQHPNREAQGLCFVEGCEITKTAQEDVGHLRVPQDGISQLRCIAYELCRLMPTILESAITHLPSQVHERENDGACPRNLSNGANHLPVQRAPF